jgi:TetR/AcrR family tetracycline transcriptional repressor
MAVDRKRIVRAALALMARKGLDGVTMRALAARLHIKGASLYHHFPNKQVLIDHMAEALLAGAWEERDPNWPWPELMRRGARVSRQMMLARRDGARLVASAYPTENAGRETLPLMIGPLRRAGFSEMGAIRALMACARYTAGWTIEEQQFIAQGRGFPSELSDAGFEFGLDAMIRGLELKLADGV